MAQSYVGRKRLRNKFGRIDEIAEMPNLIQIQKNSYDSFLIMDEPAEGRADVGLQSVFNSVFPIHDFPGKAQLEFVKYHFEQPKVRCRGMSTARHDLCGTLEGDAASDRL